MTLANQKATIEYQEAIQATKEIESPAVASKQSQKLIELEEKFDKLKQEVHTIIEKEIQPADLEDLISSLAKRLDNFSISGLQHIHLGIFMIRLHALHRRSVGTNALVVLIDTRWEDRWTHLLRETMGSNVLLQRPLLLKRSKNLEDEPLNKSSAIQQTKSSRKVALKNYKNISKKQKELESRVQSCQEKLESYEELLRKTQSETRKSLQQISTEIQQSKPLTKREVLNLVQEIVEQPKLVEKKALRLTEDLNQKIQKVEHLLYKVKKLITG
ncbi:Orf y [Tanacetum coccineum]|uniref:TPA: Orf y n=1 Tax=Tanacetum coccineum TaxID=301880 RepID=A0ABQ4Y3T7_9ASTR